MLKGNIEEKRKILFKLANELEPRKNESEKINDDLTDDIFYMFNNLNIRHNNVSIGEKYYNEYVAGMRECELEEWYDKLYQKILLANLLLDDEKGKKSIKELRRKIGEANKGRDKNSKDE